MRRFIFSTATILLICAIASGAALFVGHQQPTPDRITALHLTDCLPPCWIGIVPGKTTISEARQLLAAAFDQSPDYSLKFTIGAPYAVNGFLHGKGEVKLPLMIEFEVLAYIDNGDSSIVNEVEMLFPPLPSVPALTPTIADFHYLLGTPSRLLALSTVSEEMVNYGNDEQGVSITSTPLAWDEPISQLFFYDFANRGQQLTYILANTWAGLERRYGIPCHLTTSGHC